MTHRLIKAAQEAVEVARCDHDLMPLRYPKGSEQSKRERYVCNKCMATFITANRKQARRSPQATAEGGT